MLCHAMHHCSRPNPFSFLFECMRFKKIPKNITFYGCKLVSVFALQPQKANFSMGYYALFKFRLELNIASANQSTGQPACKQNSQILTQKSVLLMENLSASSDNKCSLFCSESKRIGSSICRNVIALVNNEHGTR